MKEYTISIFTENHIGLLSRVVTVFTRRHINVESINASPSSMKGIYRFTVVVTVTEEMVKKLVAQLDKQVDVLKSFYHDSTQIVYQELALYKVPTNIFMNGERLESLVRSHNARILSIEPEYMVLEKSGHQHETQAFFRALENHGVYEFVRSGRVAVSKPMEQLNAYLQSIEN
ncbi:MAG: acetolactate synthase small subunit [Saprospiraceae bacterium]